MMVGAGTAGNSLNHADSGALELLDFVGIIGEQPHLADTQSLQRLRGKIVVARIGSEPELAIRFHRVEPIVLQLVGSQLVDQPDTTALLRQVEHDAGPRFGDLAERKFELRTAVAALRREDIPCQALRMNSNDRRGPVSQPSVLDCYGFFALAASLDSGNSEPPEAR